MPSLIIRISRPPSQPFLSTYWVQTRWSSRAPRTRFLSAGWQLSASQTQLNSLKESIPPLILNCKQNSFVSKKRRLYLVPITANKSLRSSRKLPMTILISIFRLICVRKWKKAFWLLVPLNWLPWRWTSSVETLDRPLKSSGQPSQRRSPSWKPHPTQTLQLPTRTLILQSMKSTNRKQLA